MAKINPANLAQYAIAMEKCVYSRTKSGKIWRRKPDETSGVRIITAERYANYVDSIQFFQGFFDGGKQNERVEYGHTIVGYIPIKIVSISPDGQQKITRTFFFAESEELLWSSYTLNHWR